MPPWEWATQISSWHRSDTVARQRLSHENFADHRTIAVRYDEFVCRAMLEATALGAVLAAMAICSPDVPSMSSGMRRIASDCNENPIRDIKCVHQSCASMLNGR